LRERGREDKKRGEEKKTMQNRQIDNKPTKQIRIDAGLHQLLKVKAAQLKLTIKALLEGYLADLLGVPEGGETDEK
jgi:hypothetical protein